jgi:hypothetical protein
MLSFGDRLGFLEGRSGAVASGLRFAAGKNGLSARVLTMSAAARVLRTPAINRLGHGVIRTPETNQRRRRSVSLRGRFALYADPAAQSRPESTAPLRPVIYHSPRLREPVRRHSAHYGADGGGTGL